MEWLRLYRTATQKGKGGKVLVVDVREGADHLLLGPTLSRMSSVNIPT